MTQLIVGADSRLGRSMAKLLPSSYRTTRREAELQVAMHEGDMRLFFLDLSRPLPQKLPEAQTVYLVAAIHGPKRCEGNPEAYRVNVDAPIALAQHYSALGAFCVFVSTDAMEWVPAWAYAFQKAIAEASIRLLPNTAIVRCGAISDQTREDCARRVVDIGLRKLKGIHHWSV